jgi:hypothetical protein
VKTMDVDYRAGVCFVTTTSGESFALQLAR